MLIWVVLPKFLAELVLLLRRTHQTVRDIVRLFVRCTRCLSLHISSLFHRYGPVYCIATGDGVTNLVV